jgi:hypothetical protein
MEILGSVLLFAAAIASLVCCIMVWVKMFQHGQTTLGIVFIVLTLCCGIGGLITFIYGWVKAGQWGITNIMLIWTVCIIIGIVGNILNPAQITRFQEQMKLQQGK